MVKASEKAIRPLYASEQEYIKETIQQAKANIEVMDDLLEHVTSTTKVEAFSHKHKAYSERMFNDGQLSAFRYLAHEDILGFDRFALYESAKLAGKVDTFEDFFAYALRVIPQETILRSVLLMAFALKTFPEIKQALLDPVQWRIWWKDVSKWWVRMALATIYRGKGRETYFEECVIYFIRKYAGIKLCKTTKAKDQTYMLDYVLLVPDDEREGMWRPVLAISVKGPTYEFNSDYKLSGERREKQGHKRFRNDYPGVDVVTIISDPDAPNNAGLLGIAQTLVPFLKGLAEEGVIERL